MKSQNSNANQNKPIIEPVLFVVILFIALFLATGGGSLTGRIGKSWDEIADCVLRPLECEVAVKR